jgi:ribulose-5-phosphate 4-epimerase/fuculose-1-phosphate aldolase
VFEELKEQLVQLHLELPKNNLVTWTGGNVSARDPETGLVLTRIARMWLGCTTVTPTNMSSSLRGPF